MYMWVYVYAHVPTFFFAEEESKLLHILRCPHFSTHLLKKKNRMFPFIVNNTLLHLKLIVGPFSHYTRFIVILPKFFQNVL